MTLDLDFLATLRSDELEQVARSLTRAGDREREGRTGQVAREMDGGVG